MLLILLLELFLVVYTITKILPDDLGKITHDTRHFQWRGISKSFEPETLTDIQSV